MSLAVIFGPHPEDDARDLRFKISMVNELGLGSEAERDAVIGELRKALHAQTVLVPISRDYGEQ